MAVMLITSHCFVAFHPFSVLLLFAFLWTPIITASIYATLYCTLFCVIRTTFRFTLLVWHTVFLLCPLFSWTAGCGALE